MLKKIISNILKSALEDYLKDTDIKDIDSYIENNSKEGVKE